MLCYANSLSSLTRFDYGKRCGYVNIPVHGMVLSSVGPTPAELPPLGLLGVPQEGVHQGEELLQLLLRDRTTLALLQSRKVTREANWCISEWPFPCVHHVPC